jgi:chromosome segregation ATPase
MKKEQEMPELSSVDDDNAECIGRLRVENQKLREEIEQKQTEISSLREEIAHLRGEDNELGVPKDVWGQITGADGSIYFRNRDTNETAWEMPEEQATWEELQDEEGRAYYYNRTSGETSWEPPMISNPMRK